MKKEKVTSIVLTKGEVKEILSQAFEAQGNQNFNNLPVAILQSWANKITTKALDKFRGEYDKSANEFRAEVEKPAIAFITEVEKAAEKFDNAIKSFRMKYMK